MIFDARVHPVRQQDVDVGELRGVEQLVPQAADRDAALAVVGVVRAARGVELDRGGAGAARRRSSTRRAACPAARRSRSRGSCSAICAGRRDALGDPLRLAVGLRPVAVRGHQPEAVGVDGLEVVPVLALDAGEVHLAHGDDGVGLLAVDRVAVDVEDLRELVVAADLLQLLVGRRDDARVDQPDARQRLGVGAQLARGRRRRRGVVGDLGVRHPVRGARRVDVALDVRAARAAPRSDGR